MSYLQENEKSELSSGELRFILAFGLFLVLKFAVVIPFLIFLNPPKGSPVGLVGLFIAAFGSYWLVYSKRGPGVDGLKLWFNAVLKPIKNLPEPKRILLVAPFFAMALVYFLYTLGWLVLSDEASQKRALFNTWDRASTVQWFHHGDNVDLFVYSETLNALHEGHGFDAPKDAHVGVRINYSGELMRLRGREFHGMLLDDIRNARVGRVAGVSGDAQLGFFKGSLNDFDFIRFHGAFGLNGHDGLQIVLMQALLLMCGILFLAGCSNSFTLLMFSIGLAFLGSGPAVFGGLPHIMPELITVVSLMD